MAVELETLGSLGNTIEIPDRESDFRDTIRRALERNHFILLDDPRLVYKDEYMSTYETHIAGFHPYIGILHRGGLTPQETKVRHTDIRFGKTTHPASVCPEGIEPTT